MGANRSEGAQADTDTTPLISKNIHFKYHEIKIDKHVLPLFPLMYFRSVMYPFFLT